MSEIVRVAVRVPDGEREPAIAKLLELAPQGFEEIDCGGEVELAAYVGADGEAAIRGVFADAVSTRVEPGWGDRWREFHRPAWAGGVWLGPPWETPPAGALAVVVDPGRAFGTGAHPTTRLCLELLAGLDQRGSLLDVGCGSGVLAIAAARLGFDPIVAIDDDPVAIEVASANADANGVTLDLRVLDATAVDLPTTDVAVTNISLAAVDVVLARLRSRVAVTAGYLATDIFTAPGWQRLDRRELDGWVVDLLVRARVAAGPRLRRPLPSGPASGRRSS